MKHKIILLLIIIGVFIPAKARCDQGQISLTVNPGFTIYTKNSVYNFNNGPKLDIGIGYDTSDETNIGFVLGYNRFTNAIDSNLSLNLGYIGMAVKQYLNSGISKGYLTGGLNIDYANFSGTPSVSSGVTKPSDDAGIGFNVGAGIDVMATSSFFFGPVIKYEGVILQKTYLSLITLQLSIGLLF
ncbi:MAG: hypothetical protein ACP5JP_03570 [bacterium]